MSFVTSHVPEFQQVFVKREAALLSNPRGIRGSSLFDGSDTDNFIAQGDMEKEENSLNNWNSRYQKNRQVV